MIPDEVFKVTQLLDFRIYMSVLLTLPFIFMGMAWLPSIKEAKPASMISILRQIALYLPTMLIIPVYYGVSSIYWASALIDWFIFLLVLFTIRKSRRKLNRRIPAFD